MSPTLPGANPAIEGARAALLAWLDRLIAKAPSEYRDGLTYLRTIIADKSGTIPADIISLVLTALGKAALSGDWGPATGSDSDHA